MHPQTPRPQGAAARRRHELLSDLEAQVLRGLVEHGVDEIVAVVIANNIVDGLASHWGGQTITIPKDHLHEIHQRSLQLYQEHYQGHVAEFAKLIGLTESGARKLIARVERYLKAERQHSLF